MRKKHIAFIPFDAVNQSNAYAFRMRELLGAFGDVVPFEGTKAFALRLARLRWWRYDALFASWTDSFMLDPVTGRVSGKQLAKMFVKTLIMRIAVRRMIFVRHNNYPHHVTKGEEEKARKWVDRYERMFDVVLTHSGVHAGASRRYCPHPLYPRVSQAADVSDVAIGLPPNFFVMFGMLFPYKRIAELMALFPENRNLVVVGAVGDAAYAARLQENATANMMVRPGFLSEAEAQAILRRSSGLVLAHADADVVVSGSFFYAMGLGVRVLAVRTPFLDWVAPRVGASLLRVASDINGLADLIRHDNDQNIVLENNDTIESEFGDSAIRNVLREVLID